MSAAAEKQDRPRGFMPEHKVWLFDTPPQPMQKQIIVERSHHGQVTSTVECLSSEEERFRVDWQPPAIMVWTGEVLRGGTRRWRLRYLIGFEP